MYVARLARAAPTPSGSTPSAAPRPRPAVRGPGRAVGRPGVPRLPYPLAAVHRVVSLPGPLLADLRRDLREAFLREGLSEDDVDLVMRDFHLTLNA